MQGSIYKNKSRYWWRVKLPGKTKYEHIPLKPMGGRFATKDKAVAFEVAKALWQEAVEKVGSQEVKTISDLTSAYYQHCRIYYQKSQTAKNVKYALDFLENNTKVVYAQDFDSLALQSVRNKMIKVGWRRMVINYRVSMIKRMFKWAASQKLVPTTTYQSVATLESLKAGRSKARESRKVLPVSEDVVYKTLSYMLPVGKAMVKLQLLTGMRSTELCTIRPVDIDTSGKIWIYRPKNHKTAYKGQNRVIYIGPKAKMVIKPFLKRKVDDYCFKPEENSRKAKHYGERYSYISYRDMICRAIKTGRKTGEDIPLWHPHQLRHTAGTKIRKELGRDAARVFLGHRNPSVTDDYAEIDIALGEKAASLLG